MNPTTLVTGGAGYIGSHTAKTLANSGYTPVVLDDLSTGSGERVKWGPMIEGNIGDGELVGRILHDHKITCVFHFAASIDVAESVLDPAKYHRNNVANSVALLESCISAGVREFIFSSTAAVYGEPEGVPITEDHPTRPVNPYGESKLTFERALADCGRKNALRWMALRYFNAAGADPDGDIAVANHDDTHLIPAALGAALRLRPPLKLFGTDFGTPDGTAIRDYVHVSDVAEAHILAHRHLAGGGVSGVMNVGTGRGFSVREVIGCVERVTKLRVPIVEAGRRDGDPERLVADSTRACELLGWSPKHSDLDHIIASAFRSMTAGRTKAAVTTD